MAIYTTAATEALSFAFALSIQERESTNLCRKGQVVLCSERGRVLWDGAERKGGV